MENKFYAFEVKNILSLKSTRLRSQVANMGLNRPNTNRVKSEVVSRV